MAFTIPDAPAAAFQDQARLYSATLDILTGGPRLTGVQSGCAVTAQGSPNMTVAVAVGVVRIAGRRVSVVAGNVTITAANATNPRIDLITVDTTGTKAAVAGTAAAVPLEPAVPAGRVVLAQVYVPANGTTIGSSQIVDRGLAVNAPLSENLKWYGAQGDGKTVTDGAMTTGTSTLTSATAGFTSADVGKRIHVTRASSTAVELYTKIVSITNGTTAVIAVAPGFSLTGRTIWIDEKRSVTDGVTTANSTTITSATAAFTAADVGKQIRINAAHSVAIAGTISAVTNSTTVTLSVSATRTVSGASVTYGTDDTDALITALEVCRDNALAGYGATECYAPAGMYLIEPRTGQSTCPLLYSNTSLRGDGSATIFRDRGGVPAVNDATSLIGVNSWERGTSNPDQNVTNVRIRDLQLWGTTMEDGFHQWTHLFQCNAGSDITLERVRFYNWKGDGIYLGSGSSGATVERHNQRIRILWCNFHGGNKDNRNGTTIIDAEDLIIAGCTYEWCTRNGMPGAIDTEPNVSFTYAIIRDHKIVQNRFFNVGGTGSGVISYYLLIAQASFTNGAPHGIVIADNVIRDCNNSQAINLSQGTQNPSDTTPELAAVVRNNHVKGVPIPLALDAVCGVRVQDNLFEDSTEGCVFGWSNPPRDVQVYRNHYRRVATVTGAVNNIYRGFMIAFERNLFDDIGLTNNTYGVLFKFTLGSGSTGSSDFIDSIDNRVIRAGYTAHEEKNASHTLTAARNRASGNRRIDLAGNTNAAITASTTVYNATT